MERRQPRWEKGQSLLHKEHRERFRQENVFGKLEYVTEEKERREKKEGAPKERVKKGFVMEAKESPGTPLHGEKEKRLE